MVEQFRQVWESKITTVVFALAAITGVIISTVADFGAPSPSKVIFRCVLVGMLAAQFAAAYPGSMRQLLFETQSGVLPRVRWNKGDLRFFAMIGFILVVGSAYSWRHITEFLTIDEPKWLVTRVPGFFHALISFNWHDMLISDKPGVTLAWIVELGLIFTNKEGSFSTLGDPGLLFFSRAPLVLFNALLLLWLTHLVKRASGNKLTALLFLALTATNPTILGMASIVNPDSISWFFPLAIILVFILYLRDRHPWDLVQGAVIFASGVLNKFNFLTAFPFLPLAIVLYYLFIGTKRRHFFRSAGQGIVRIYALSCLFAVFLWPYLLLAPQHYVYQTLLRPLVRPFFVPILIGLVVFYLFGTQLEKYIQKLSALLRIISLAVVPALALIAFTLTVWSTSGLPSIERASNVQAQIIELALNNYFYHIYSQTTFTLILYVGSLLVLMFAAFRQDQNNTTLLLCGISVIFIQYYLIGSAATGHITVPRYQIPVFPAVALFVAGAVSLVIDQVRAGLVASRLLPWASSSAVVAVAAINFSLVGAFAPYSLFYHNHFLPPGKLVFEGWGLGGYEAAQYLNRKPNAEKMQVYTSWAGFDMFFHGTSVKREGDPFDPPVDYLVIFKQGENKVSIGWDPKKNEYWRYQAKPEFQMIVNGVPIVKVIKNR